jgi:DNA-binding beta-propeller fold protein YncE
VLALALVACGSRPESELPPAATPGPAAVLSEPPEGRVTGRDGFGDAEPELEVIAADRSVEVDRGRAVASLAAQRRVVELFDARTPRRLGRADAGVGPYGLASDGDNYLYVTDVKLGAVLVFRVRPELRLIRRLALPGGPTEIVYDREHRRLWTVLSEANELVELRVGARTGVLRRFPAVRAPRGVTVTGGRVMVTNADGEFQLVDPRR